MVAVSDIWSEVTLKAKALELRLLPGLGGRLWDVRLYGQSILFQNPDLAGCAFDPDMLGALPTRSPHFGFPLWGGEKTWVAPDTDWPEGRPHSMLDSGPYRIVDRSAQAVEMASRDCPMTGLAITRRVTLLSQDAWTIHHRIRNNGTMSRFAGIWSVMMLNHPASIAVPAIRPAISPVFGSAGDLVRANDLGVIATCRERQEFKVAIPNPTGRVLIRCPDLETWVHTETPPPRSDDVFAHSLPFEIFNSGDYAYCEAEWHAPAARLAPGAETSFEQKFRIWRRRESPPDLALTTDERELMTCMS